MIAALASLVIALAAAPSSHDGDGSGRVDERGRYVSRVSPPNVIADQARATEEAFIPDEDCRNVDLPPMVVPVVAGERLSAYAFVTVRLCMSDRADHWNVRDEQHFLLDRLVKTAHAVPFRSSGRGAYDRSATEAAFIAEAEAMIGEGMVEEIHLLGGDIRPLNN
ncbi:hypothetical protein DDZ18_05305 [Marinicauda salina]|uniref:Uncharacterized protein n=1 Tax=Marinicauda salina TaxID=2135793 RepID=A0A2U2BVG4_9PROT|nr:hypothetical protein [Marinicauda salina]PWE17992.1 hypothetical protein DDZ18_05305 [Marinicauda salina]